MERRAFLRTGLAAGVFSAGVTASVPSLLEATTPGVGGRRRRRSGPIRLSSNENPLGISPAAREAIIEGIVDANRYPGNTASQVVDALAAKHSVTPEHIVLGNGSTEVLQMTVQAIATQGGTFIVADPTFEDVPRYVEPFGLKVEKVPLRRDYSHDVDRMADLARKAAGPVFAYVCNPNNPTGSLTASDELDQWIASAADRVWFVMDEAYYEFAEHVPGYRSALDKIDAHPNVIVVRTFSKIHGMAGVRLGYGLAHPDTIERVRDFRAANNANKLVLYGALASLGDKAFQQRSLESNRKGMKIGQRVLDELGLDCLPSHANFMMHRIHGELETYIERMRDRGIRVGRPFPPMLGYNRVSIGLPEEMETFAEALRGFRKKGWV